MMRNQYSMSEFISTSWSFIITKIFYRPARLIRRPIYMRGKNFISIGKGLTLGHNCRFDCNGQTETLFIGERVEMGDNVHIVAYKNVKIGDDVLIASKVFISDTNHGNYLTGVKNADTPDSSPNSRALVYKGTSIGDNCWIGENAVILPGSQIGRGSIIGANSVVNRVIPENCIAAGIPAKVIKQYNLVNGQWGNTGGGIK